jgi:hypothetical protein
MAVQIRHLLSRVPVYCGIETLNAVDAGTVVSGALAVSFFDLAPGHNASQFKCALVFIDITAIVGTWTFTIATELRVAQVALGNAKFNPANVLAAAAVTTVSKQRAGFNLFSGVNTILGDVVYLEVRNTAGASPTVTLSADAVLYN